MNSTLHLYETPPFPIIHNRVPIIPLVNQANKQISFNKINIPVVYNFPALSLPLSYVS